MEPTKWSQFGKKFSYLNRSILKSLPKNRIPEDKYVFKAFTDTPPNKVRVVILGMDPYPTPGNAIGRAFAVSPTTPKPKSLLVIEKELQRMYGETKELDRTLQHWVDQGVLLLNVALTVEPGKSGSHIGKWQPFTEELLKAMASKLSRPVYLLMGNNARDFMKFVSSRPIVDVCHPAARGQYNAFIGSGVFEKVNAKLDRPIKWL